MANGHLLAANRSGIFSTVSGILSQGMFTLAGPVFPQWDKDKAHARMLKPELVGGNRKTFISEVRLASSPGEIIALCNEWDAYRGVPPLVARYSRVFSWKILDRIHTYDSVGLDVAANPLSTKLCFSHLLALVEEEPEEVFGFSFGTLLSTLLLHAWRDNLHITREEAQLLLPAAAKHLEEHERWSVWPAFVISEGLGAITREEGSTSKIFLGAARPHLKLALRFAARALARSEYVSVEELRRFTAYFIEEREEVFRGFLEGMEERETPHGEDMADFLLENMHANSWARAALLYSPREEDFVKAVELLEQKLPVLILSRLLQGCWVGSSKLEALPIEMRARLLAKVDAGTRLHIIRSLGERQAMSNPVYYSGQEDMGDNFDDMSFNK